MKKRNQKRIVTNLETNTTFGRIAFLAKTKQKYLIRQVCSAIVFITSVGHRGLCAIVFTKEPVTIEFERSISLLVLKLHRRLSDVSRKLLGSHQCIARSSWALRFSFHVFMYLYLRDR